MTSTLGQITKSPLGAGSAQDMMTAKPTGKSFADLQSDVLEAARAESEIARAEKEEKLFAETETARQNVANREQYIKDLAQPEKRKALETQVAEKAKPFIPHQDNIDDLTKLFVTTNLMGFLLGGRGKMNAQAAMSAQNGMLEGHLKGNQDLYKREKDIFEENQKVLTQSIEQLRNELKDAAELAKNNYELAEQKTRDYIAKHGFTTLMPFYEKSKIVPTLSVVERIYKMAMDNEAKIRQENKDARAMAHQEFMEKHYSFQEGHQLREEALQRERMLKQSGSSGETYALEERYNIPSNEINRLNKDEKATVASKVESSRLTSELADMIKANPYAAGLAGQFLNKADKYIPGNYDVSTAKGVLSSAIDSDTSIQGDPDTISDARIIAKKALDVINARALSVSRRLLVSELRMQKDVLDISNMSSKSAYNVYKSLAQGDLESLRKEGLSDKTINSLQNQLNVRSSVPEKKEYKGTGTANDPIKLD